MALRLAFALCLCCVSAAAQAQSGTALQPGELSGDWSASDTNPSGKCQLMLEVSPESMGYSAYAFGCTGEDLHRVAGWRLRGTSIVLTDAQGKPLILLKMKDRKRFEGAGPSRVKVVISR